MISGAIRIQPEKNINITCLELPDFCKQYIYLQEYVGRKSLETTIEEVDRLKDRLTKTDQEK